MQLSSPADSAGRVTAALKAAAQATGASFDYLLKTAKRESSLNATAKAPTSSARGLFQFIDQTWLQVLKEDGPALGYADEAADVTKTESGRYTVADPQRKAELLALRDDPTASALLAGAYTHRNADTLNDAFGRSATSGELYAAHFLGPQGAVQLVTLAATTPDAPAASAFPAQAAANRSIFYDKGRPLSALEVYGKVTAAHDAVATVAASAEATPTAANTALALQSVQETADVTPFNHGVEDDSQTFHSLFKTGRRSPVSSYVSEAWSSFKSGGLAADAVGVGATAAVATSTASATGVSATASTVATAAAARTTVVAEATAALDNALDPKSFSRVTVRPPAPAARSATP